MLSTKYLLQSCKDVPETWIFEHYCKLTEKLAGQDVKIKSLFNPKDKTPSMYIFFFSVKNRYMFKDFSTGQGGTAIKLVQLLYNESFIDSSRRILEDYNNYILLNNNTEHKITEFKVRSKYKVTDCCDRHWKARDKKFWEQFNIGSSLLEKYNVLPLDSYTMTKEEDGELKSLEIKGLMIYGYFNSQGLYKIYQPNVKEHKFIKIESYTQGLEQLSNSPILLICSSLKDGMSIKSLGVSCDIVAPDSENTMLKPAQIESLRAKYNSILTIFDNDDAGLTAMKKYKEVYDIEFVYLDLEKDVADAIKVHGPEKVRNKLIPLIDKKLYSCA